MGYYIDQVDHNFFIDNKHIPSLIATIHSLSKDESNMSGGSFDSSQKIYSCYSWVNMSFTDYNDIKEIFKCWRWHIDQDENGNIDSINFEGQKLGDDDILLRAIAPYVKDGSYIEIRGEDNSLWRWAFKNGKFMETYPNISWNY
jgi:hypothetical protein